MPAKNPNHNPKCQPPIGADCSALDGWLDDGGSLQPAPVGPVPRSTKAKLAADTVQGCRDRAAADLLASVAMTTDNGRLKMEASANSWTARADLLQRLEDSFEARIAAQRLMR